MPLPRPSLLCLALAAPLPAAAADPLGPFDCVMDPNLVLELGAPVPGLLAEVTVAQGDEVTAGQPVARLDSTVEMSTIALLELRAGSDVAIEAQRAQLQAVTGQRDRIATLVERNVASAEQLEQVEAEVVTARALLAQAELEKEVAALELARAHSQLAQRTIAAPVDGIVQEIGREGGEYVAANGTVMTIAQLDPLRIVAFLPVELYPALSLGMAARVVPAAPFDSDHVATLTGIDRIFDAASGTFAVHLDLPNPDGALPAGHRCLLSFGDGS